jgi:PKD repeat protein
MRLLTLVCFFLLILAILASEKSAFGYSRITQVNLFVPVHGLATQKIDIQADIYTGNNLVEYTHDVEVTVLLPPNVTIISGENPLFIGEMGPGPAYARCRWSLEFEEPGEYVVMVNATCIDTQKLPQWMNASAAIGIYAPPHVEFEYDPASDVHINDTVTFNATNTYARGPNSTIVSYSWNFGDNATATSNETIIVHSFSIAGNYTVSLNVTDNNELSSMEIKEIFVSEKGLIGDINSDGKVNIQDISIVAIAYGTSEGEPRWNPNCDLNHDTIINILDLSIVATQYGMTK